MRIGIRPNGSSRIRNILFTGEQKICHEQRACVFLFSQSSYFYTINNVWRKAEENERALKKKSIYFIIFHTRSSRYPVRFRSFESQSLSFTLNNIVFWSTLFDSSVYTVITFRTELHISRYFMHKKSILKHLFDAALLSLLVDLVLICFSCVHACVFVQRIIKYKHNENENTFEHSGTMNNIIHITLWIRVEWVQR